MFQQKKPTAPTKGIVALHAHYCKKSKARNQNYYKYHYFKSPPPGTNNSIAEPSSNQGAQFPNPVSKVPSIVHAIASAEPEHLYIRRLLFLSPAPPDDKCSGKDDGTRCCAGFARAVGGAGGEGAPRPAQLRR